MCRALLPENEADMNDETIWETLPHFWVAISMVFLVAATTFTLLKLSAWFMVLGRELVVHWEPTPWVLWRVHFPFFIWGQELEQTLMGSNGGGNGIAKCFAFLVCTKWSNPLIHGHSQSSEASSSSLSFRSFDWTSSFLFSSEIDENHDGMCILENIGGHVMKIPVLGFQVLLCMHLEGTPPGASHISIPVRFSPLFLLQGAGVLVAILRLGENIFLLLHSGTCTGSYFTFSSRAYISLGSCTVVQGRLCFNQLAIELPLPQHIDTLNMTCGRGIGVSPNCIISNSMAAKSESSYINPHNLVSDRMSRYNTFCGYPPEVVKKMAKKDLAEEVWRLQSALGEQAEASKHCQQEYERLQTEKVLCRVCFVRDISVVLLPCRHHILCSNCAEKCKKCPICRISVKERMHVYDV